MGHTEFTGEVRHPFHIVRKAETAADSWDGALSRDGLVLGTYIHGIFDHDAFRRALLNRLRSRKGLSELVIQRNRRAEKEKAYDRLARIVRESLDMQKLARIMGEDGTC